MLFLSQILVIVTQFLRESINSRGCSRENMGVPVEYNYSTIIRIPVSVTGRSVNLAPASGTPDVLGER